MIMYNEESMYEYKLHQVFSEVRISICICIIIYSSKLNIFYNFPLLYKNT